MVLLHDVKLQKGILFSAKCQVHIRYGIIVFVQILYFLVYFFLEYIGEKKRTIEPAHVGAIHEQVMRLAVYNTLYRGKNTYR